MIINSLMGPLISAGIIGVGKELPEKAVSNQDIVDMGLDTSDEWISERTGIKNRYIADENTSSVDLAEIAAKRAIENAGINVTDLDGIIVSTTTPDHLMFPSAACLLQSRIGARNIFALDVSAACTGFNYAISTGSQFVRTGQMKTVLVVAVDCLSKFVDWTDRSVCPLFGDGAGAVIVSEVKEGYGVLTIDLSSDGRYGDILKVQAGGSRQPMTQDSFDNKDHLIQMAGRAVFKTAVSKLVPSIRSVLEKYELSVEDIGTFVFHQANIRIIEFVKEKLGIADEQLYTNIHKYGNTSSASIPIVLDDKKSSFKDGELVMLIGFGAGFAWGVNIVKWGGRL